VKSRIVSCSCAERRLSQFRFDRFPVLHTQYLAQQVLACRDVGIHLRRSDVLIRARAMTRMADERCKSAKG